MEPHSEGSETELSDWIALSQAPGIGPRTFARLLEHFGSPAAVLRAPASRLADAGLKPAAVAAIGAPDQDAIEASLRWAERTDAYVLTLADAAYPPALREIPDPPPLLYVRGDLSLLTEPQLAIVGSRNPTPGGREITRELARALAAYGLVITSGMATGIDGIAHEAALEVGRTVAVLGTGPDLVYPAAHRELAHRIVESGALVSELPPGQGPLPQNFPRRNRIISGLCLGVLVTEAALKSGSLITARMALEQGREVFAVPGSIRSPLAQGCHSLIRDGAKLIQSPDEILTELAPQLKALIAADAGAAASQIRPLEAALDEGQKALLDAMGFDPVAPDELIARTGLTADRISSMLLLMEIEGHVSSVPGGRYCRMRGDR
ncbi:DNA-protecting protein DprA [Thiorhodococcus mannitoliphagus]|uniref:DNA-protecting protein DprA n=1 Tax=Thiorhodococcus mannitoliphagus TaxID=329406 RepID=A0A6P1DSI1_9GAMM|nr:DNA-processing protein DprA [Thiorhodococcus mannitoliphagus]NEX19656.1 DNA-protecting protein DprA [Thiorhodococcus mannitoliphagus]